MSQIVQDVAQARNNWGWYVALGIVLILVGIYAIWAEGAATVASVWALGIVLVIAGIAQLITGIHGSRSRTHHFAAVSWSSGHHRGTVADRASRRWSPAITLLLAVLLVFGGIFRFVSALWMQFPQYGWVAVSGALSTVLASPLVAVAVSAIWFIGLVVGLNFIFAGVSWTWLGWKLKPA